MADGRNNSFDTGFGEVREPMFHTMQQPNAQFQTTSVLDNLYPTGNGFGAGDRSRLLLHGNDVLPSQNGSSQQTYEENQILTTPYRTFG